MRLTSTWRQKKLFSHKIPLSVPPKEDINHISTQLIIKIIITQQQPTFDPLLTDACILRSSPRNPFLNTAVSSSSVVIEERSPFIITTRRFTKSSRCWSIKIRVSIRNNNCRRRPKREWKEIAVALPVQSPAKLIWYKSNVETDLSYQLRTAIPAESVSSAVKTVINALYLSHKPPQWPSSSSSSSPWPLPQL